MVSEAGCEGFVEGSESEAAGVGDEEWGMDGLLRIEFLLLLWGPGSWLEEEGAVWVFFGVGPPW